MTEKENKKERHLILEILLFLLLVSLIANMALWARADSRSILYQHRIDSLLDVGRDLRNELSLSAKDNKHYRQVTSLLDSLLYLASCEIQDNKSLPEVLDLKSVRIKSFEKSIEGKGWIEGNIAGKVSKLEICFAATGPNDFGKNIYSLKIFDPEGKPVMGNKISTALEPQKISSSYAGLGAKQRSATNICLSYEVKEPVLHSGIYALEIYSKGSLLKTLHHQLR